jgi:hypothetical protein
LSSQREPDILWRILRADRVPHLSVDVSSGISWLQISRGFKCVDGDGHWFRILDLQLQALPRIAVQPVFLRAEIAGKD